MPEGSEVGTNKSPILKKDLTNIQQHVLYQNMT